MYMLVSFFMLISSFTRWLYVAYAEAQMHRPKSKRPDYVDVIVQLVSMSISIFHKINLTIYGSKRASRIKFLVRQNSKEFEYKVRFYLGELLEMSNSDPTLDISIMTDTVIETFDRIYSRAKVQFGVWLDEKSWALERKRTNKRSVITLLHYEGSKIVNVIAQYIAKYIHHNGGLYYHGKRY